MNTSQKHSSKPNKFLLRLFNILSEPKYSHIISWTDSGTSFAIKKIPEFTISILPLYFKHKNFSSFVRQLNMYNFHKERDTGEIQVYVHPCFIKGEKDKLANVHRKTSDLYVESKPASTLEKKYNTIRSKQKILSEKICMLEQNYQEVAIYNQSLLYQIFQSREREQKIEQLLLMFIEQVKEVPPFLEPFYKKKTEFEIIRPIPIPFHHQFNILQ
ncbi:hypothetical protein SteCoe_24139 [Stentor coeruleus]|uniref:HSF-type DNA-binding domain-containing protein n=1 Tax=Stentor coeruleus TaxID=5963 RepID=A0A1R2BI62_9CILI|nr:hypothetical protein SteCoe_24139 [Stentor coeruleus]